jgi:hypothetical protein
MRGAWIGARWFAANAFDILMRACLAGAAAQAHPRELF